MAGSLPTSNSTSTTGPMTWTILPWLISRFLSVLAIYSALGSKCTRALRFNGLPESFSAADDIQELLGDALLAGLVVLNGQQIDHLARVLRRGLHRRHARAVLAGRGLHERAVDLGRHVARQERGEDGLGAGLVEVLLLRSPIAIGGAFGLDGQELLPQWALHGHRAELVVHEVDLVHLLHQVGADQLIRELLGVGVGQAVEEAQHL